MNSAQQINMETVNVEIIRKAIEKFRGLDEFHTEDYPRLDMESWGTDGIAEYLGLIDARDNFADYNSYGFEPEDIDKYDRDRRGFVDDEDPDRIIDLYSDEGQEIFYDYIRHATEEEANEQFRERYSDLFDNPTQNEACGTAGCAAYWINLWFAPEDKLHEMKTVTKVEKAATELMGLDVEVANALMVPTYEGEDDERIFEHARPSHVATVLVNFLDTGVMSWEGVVPRCDYLFCTACDDEDEEEGA